MQRAPLAEQQIATALDQAEPGLRKYLWIMQRVHRCDVRFDAEFQRTYNDFYKVRQNDVWRRSYYDVLEHAKTTPMTFSDALRAIHSATDVVAPSFASKLVATLDPSLPVWDRHVLDNLGLRAPYHYQRDRVERCERTYTELLQRMTELVASPEGQRICAAFARRYPAVGITDMKRVDLVLWRIRA